MLMNGTDTTVNALESDREQTQENSVIQRFTAPPALLEGFLLPAWPSVASFTMKAFRYHTDATA